MKPWKSLLEIPARASWRVTENTLSSEPSAVAEATRSLLQSCVIRSSFQAANCHQHVVQQQKSLANRRDRERLRILMDNDGYNYVDKKGSKTDTKSQPIIYGLDETLQQIRFRLIPQYAIMKRVLQETKSLLMTSDSTIENWKPQRILDFGIGCGSASAAALDIWNNNDLHAVSWVHGIDASQTMRETSQSFLEDVVRLQSNRIPADKVDQTRPESAITRITTSSHLTSSFGSGVGFDLAMMSYTASEFSQNAPILTSAALLWQKLSPNGVFVMIEPGTPDGFSSVRMVRNMLLQCVNENKESETLNQVVEECHVIAPCTHNGPCPLERFHTIKRKLKNRSEKQQSTNQPESNYVNSVEEGRESVASDNSEGSDTSDDENDNGESSEEDEMTHQGFCSFVQTMPDSAKGEKFTYLVLQKRFIDRDEQTHNFNVNKSHQTHFERLKIVDILRKTQEESDSARRELLLNQAIEVESQFLASSDDELGLELLRGDVNRNSFGRIIRAPKKKKKHVIVDVCASPGVLVRHTVPKSMDAELPGIYSAARKSRWGGLWPNVDLSAPKTSS
jgi:ribosomal protein RSM22 (predicted rRNA methylase)